MDDLRTSSDVLFVCHPFFHTYQWNDIKYFVDERAQGALEEYDGQSINIMYA